MNDQIKRNKTWTTSRVPAPMQSKTRVYFYAFRCFVLTQKGPCTHDSRLTAAAQVIKRRLKSQRRARRILQPFQDGRTKTPPPPTTTKPTG